MCAKQFAACHLLKRQEVKAKFYAVAKEFGFASTDDLVGEKPAKLTKPMVLVFRNPDDYSQVCGGK